MFSFARIILGVWIFIDVESFFRVLISNDYVILIKYEVPISIVFVNHNRIDLIIVTSQCHKHRARNQSQGNGFDALFGREETSENKGLVESIYFLFSSGGFFGNESRNCRFSSITYSFPFMISKQPNGA